MARLFRRRRIVRLTMTTTTQTTTKNTMPPDSRPSVVLVIRIAEPVWIGSAPIHPHQLRAIYWRTKTGKHEYCMYRVCQEKPVFEELEHFNCCNNTKYKNWEFLFLNKTYLNVLVLNRLYLLRKMQWNGHHKPMLTMWIENAPRSEQILTYYWRWTTKCTPQNTRSILVQTMLKMSSSISNNLYSSLQPLVNRSLDQLLGANYKKILRYLTMW